MESVTEMNIVEAVELLSNISDLKLDKELGILKKSDKETGQITFKTAQALSPKEKEKGLFIIEDAFRKSLKCLSTFYKDQYAKKKWKETEDRIKSIMVMVGDCAKKLDKYGNQIVKKKYKSVTSYREYKNLQEFYQKNISSTITEGVLGKWILEVAKGAWEGGQQAKERLYSKKHPSLKTNRIFVDLESVKNDTEYELFYLRKEDGGRFFSPELIRNIKLVSDFGDFVNKSKPGDLLTDIDIWQDRTTQNAAKEMINFAHKELDLFFKDLFKHRDHELVGWLSQAIMALILASNPKNLKKEPSHKSCGDYFKDFLAFYKNALISKEYQRLVAFPPKKSHVIGSSIIKVVGSLSRALFEHKGFIACSKPLVRQLLDEGKREVSSEQVKNDSTIWSQLALSSKAMDKVIKTHANGPLNKVIESIIRGQYNRFEPISSENLPGHLFTIYNESESVAVLRIPSPTYQESIGKAEVISEFSAFLRNGQKHLMVVLQDRTTWKECSRAFSLEALNEGCEVITLPVDTDFYNQTQLYFEDQSLDSFSDQLIDFAVDANAGYFFSESNKELIEPMVPIIVETIHSLFFKNKKRLNRLEKMVFIDLFYLFITLKTIDIVKPDSLSFTCKDALDKGNLFSAFMWVFINSFSDESIDKEKMQDLETMIFAPPLLSRERAPVKGRFARFVHVVKHLEGVKDSMGFERYKKEVRDTLKLILDNDISHSWAGG